MTRIEQVVWRHCRASVEARAEDIIIAVREAVTEEYVWRGVHPFDELRGVESVADGFWRPLRGSIPDLERRDDVFFAGRYEDRDWVCAMGHLFGTFARDWLGIPATGRCVWLRFGEFHRVDGGKVAETYCFVDVPGVMRQAGVPVLPRGLGPEVLVPGPGAQDGVVFGEGDEDESRATLELIEAMIFGGLMSFDRSDLGSMGMERYWHPNFMWYGPDGIGTTRGIGGFQAHHQEPFLRAFPDRKGGNHKARIANGPYGASTGWPSITATHSGGGWLGLAPTRRRVTMRVMDVWRREGATLRENWVFIDLLDLLSQLGVDVLGRLGEYRRVPPVDPLSGRTSKDPDA